MRAIAHSLPRCGQCSTSCLAVDGVESIHAGLEPAVALPQIMKQDEDVRMISAEAPILFAKVRWGVVCARDRPRIVQAGRCALCSMNSPC